MANLMEELDALRETNRLLQNTVDDLVRKLEQQEVSVASVMHLVLACSWILSHSGKLFWQRQAW